MLTAATGQEKVKEALLPAAMASPQQRYSQHSGQEELLNSFNQLEITTARNTHNHKNNSKTPSPSLSPLQSPYYRPETSHSYLRNDQYARPPSQQQQHQEQRAPRRTTSTTSLRDERRSSTHSLQKRASISSLRSVQNLTASSSSPRQSLSRRSSAQHLASSPGASGRPISPLAEMVSPTSSEIAAQHFGRELALHQAAELHSRTVVIIQDACYGHRFSRPRTSKAGLELIVERPERIQACVLGLAAAYIRMSHRYGGNEFAPHPDLDLRRLPPPPFQIRKSVRTMPLNSPAVTHVHGTKWMEELRLMCDAAEGRLAMNGKELVRPSSSGKETGANAAPELHDRDLYLCPESLNAFEGALGGVCDAVDSVFTSPSTRRAFVCIRPPGHHCSSSYPSGFCWLNNVHVGISYAAMTHGLTHAAILDFDLHHGDGSQAIAWEQNQRATNAAKNAAGYKKTAIGYFSMHDINSYPCEEGDEIKIRGASVCIENNHGQNVWNVHMESWKTPQEFWKIYQTKYYTLIEKARAFLRAHSLQLRSNTSLNAPQPKAAIFLSAGFDASEWEGSNMQRHKVNVPTDFYAKFTADVVRMAQEEDLAVDGRVISVLEGGYSDRALTSGVFSHLSGLSDSPNFEIKDDQNGSRLAAEMRHRLGLSEETKDEASADMYRASSTYDTIWWAPSLLEELEALVNPSSTTPRKPREKAQPTFSAPTQASAAKVIPPSQIHRSPSFNRTRSRTSSPTPLPPPRVEWAVAAFELSKALIPTDRQTASCQHADLKAHTTQSRPGSRLASGGSTLPPRSNERSSGHMQLRERKPRIPALPTDRLGSPRSSTPSTRRTTIASVNDLPDPSMAVNDGSANSSSYRRSSRRISLASTASASPASSTTRMNISKPRASSRPSPSRASQRAESQNSTSRARTASSSRASTPARSTTKKPWENAGNVDNLEASVKKLSIKLNVPSPEENAAREAKLAQDRKKDLLLASQSSRRKPASRTTSGTKVTSNEVNERLARPNSRSATAIPTAGRASESRVAAKAGQFSPSRNTSSNAHALPPVRGSGPALSHNGKATGREPGSATSTPKGTNNMPSPPLTPDAPPEPGTPTITVRSPPASAHQQLPVFTATSVIPFAPTEDPPSHS
ncbi:histone deacetylase HOS3 [Nannizzia gypsea CBS 118893]|uniref:Histone deacetylase HOS3 n=1 Tax=Arthroderma gypseum (strain ATCC MYA-4604 / CBS 118893) TaxID=535722 RepID=E4V653_ARTGP|nr:histone deacetylase HOS3 [Nannizzia gypsea CBS 118893]EFR05236.1 histone deacetylase HOS3 [Nannizzia gypsea CBS 118893]